MVARVAMVDPWPLLAFHPRSRSPSSPSWVTKQYKHETRLAFSKKWTKGVTPDQTLDLPWTRPV